MLKWITSLLTVNWLYWRVMLILFSHNYDNILMFDNCTSPYSCSSPLHFLAYFRLVVSWWTHHSIAVVLPFIVITLRLHRCTAIIDLGVQHFFKLAFLTSSKYHPKFHHLANFNPNPQFAPLTVQNCTLHEAGHLFGGHHLAHCGQPKIEGCNFLTTITLSDSNSAHWIRVSIQRVGWWLA